MMLRLPLLRRAPLLRPCLLGAQLLEIRIKPCTTVAVSNTSRPFRVQI
jgi:hypothetical protein